MTSILEQRNAERQAKENGYSLSWLEQLRSRRTENEAVLDSPVDIAQLTKEVIPDELDVSPNLTGRPRGSIARPGIAQVGAYNFRTKSEVWAYNLTKLYEEAVTPPVELGHGHSVGVHESSARRHRGRRMPAVHLLC